MMLFEDNIACSRRSPVNSSFSNLNVHIVNGNKGLLLLFRCNNENSIDWSRSHKVFYSHSFRSDWSYFSYKYSKLAHSKRHLAVCALSIWEKRIHITCMLSYLLFFSFLFSPFLSFFFSFWITSSVFSHKTHFSLTSA